MFVPAIVPAVMTGALFMMTSATMGGGMRTADSDPLGAIAIGAGILAYFVGRAWMIRIYRTDPEAHRSFWRSRRF